MKKKILLSIIIVTVLCGSIIYGLFIKKSPSIDSSENGILSPTDIPLKDNNENNTAESSEQGTYPNQQETPEPYPSQQETPEPYLIDWSAISADGVNESQFLENLNIDKLETISTELQALASEIYEKERANPILAIEGKWVDWINESERYKKVLEMGDSAMPPLYWIIYKSENAGFYEWLCSLALDELSGYDFTDESGISWSDSKDFLRRFNEIIISNKQ